MSDMVSDVSKTVHEALEGIRRSIGSRWRQMTCDDVSRIYYEVLSTEFRTFKGSSSGFTGFSEWLVGLILRELVSYLQVDLRLEQDKRRTLDHPIEWPDGYIQKAVQPDIILCEGTSLTCAVEVKASPVNEVETIKVAITKLEALRRNRLARSLRALVVIFTTNTLDLNERLKLEDKTGWGDWCACVSLAGNAALFWECLSRGLDLARWRRSPGA